MYEIIFKKSAVKELSKIPKKDQVSLSKAIRTLAEVPLPQGVRKIIGKQNLFRIRSGNYRIIYSIIEEQLIIEVVRIGHRREVYRF